MNITRTQNYVPTKNNKFLFDANIWIAICWPVKTKQSYNDAVNFFHKTVTNRSKILLPAIIVSEVINRIHRDEFQKYKEKYPSINKFKDYRKTKNFQIVNNDIKSVFHAQIVKLQKSKIIEIIDDGFEGCSLEMMINDLDKLDFNDSLVFKICKKNDCYLVTNDSDFFKFYNDVNIFTSLSKKA